MWKARAGNGKTGTSGVGVQQANPLYNPKTWTRNASGRGAFLKATKLYRKEQWIFKKRECRNE